MGGSIRWAKQPKTCLEVAQVKVKNGDKLRTWTSGPKYNTHFQIHYIDCEWNSWSHWSTCSASCGGGEQSRKRERAREKRLDFGQPCRGPSSEREACNTMACA